MNDEMLRILIIEDEESHAELIRRTFERSSRPFNLMIVPSLAKAKEQLDQSPPHLIITDMLLPDGNGIALLEGQDVVGDVHGAGLCCHVAR